MGMFAFSVFAYVYIEFHLYRVLKCSKVSKSKFYNQIFHFVAYIII